jgi:hypothetical protein
MRPRVRVLAPTTVLLLAVTLGLAGCLPTTTAPDPSTGKSGAGTTTTTTTTTTVPPATVTGRPFSAASPWNTPLAASTTWRDEPRLRADHWWVNRESYSLPVVEGAPGDPVVSVTVPASWGWPAGVLALHVPAGITGAEGSDGALTIVSDGVAYDFWQFQRTDATHASAAAYAEADLAGTGVGTLSPFRGAGIRSAGSSGLGGLITGRDVSAGDIPHALAVSVLGNLLQPRFVAPAIAGDGDAATGAVPTGARLGIPAGTPMPTGLSPLGQAIWRALVTYGAYVVDQHSGTAPVILYADPLGVPGAPIDPVRVFWSGTPSDLDRIMPFVRVVS